MADNDPGIAYPNDKSILEQMRRKLKNICFLGIGGKVTDEQIIIGPPIPPNPSPDSGSDRIMFMIQGIDSGAGQYLGNKLQDLSTCTAGTDWTDTGGTNNLPPNISYVNGGGQPDCLCINLDEENLKGHRIGPAYPKDSSLTGSTIQIFYGDYRGQDQYGKTIIWFRGGLGSLDGAQVINTASQHWTYENGNGSSKGTPVTLTIPVVFGGTGAGTFTITIDATGRIRGVTT